MIKERTADMAAVTECSTSPLCRFARFARLKPGAEADYDRLHAAVWPEVLDAIRQAGIRNYSIFRHGRWLFSYFELPEGTDLASVVGVLLADPACARWEELIKPLQEPVAGGDGRTHWEPMELVFHAGGDLVDATPRRVMGKQEAARAPLLRQEDGYA